MKQSIYAQSATPKYPVGYRIQVGLRVFHYSRAISALKSKRGEGDSGTLLEMLLLFAVANQGDTTITVVTAAPVIHEFVGGWFQAWDGLAALESVNLLRIKDNDAPVGPNTTFYLKDPLTRRVGILATDTNDLYRNIYNNVETRAGGPAASQSQSTVCVPLIDVTINNYFWGQTWGPCMGIAQAGAGIGANAFESAVYFANDGSIGIMGDCGGGATQLPQYAGYMLGERRNAAGALGDSLFYMLQLAP